MANELQRRGKMEKETHPFSEVVRKGFRDGAVFGWLLERNRSSKGGQGRAGAPYQFRPGTGAPAPFASSLWLCSGLLQSLCLDHPLWTGSFCFLSSILPARPDNHKLVVHGPSSFSDTFLWPIQCFYKVLLN